MYYRTFGSGRVGVGRGLRGLIYSSTTVFLFFLYFFFTLMLCINSNTTNSKANVVSNWGDDCEKTTTLISTGGVHIKKYKKTLG